MKKWTKEEIKNLLDTNPAFVGRAIVKIYERQTSEEQSNGATIKNNGVGFNGLDASLLTDFAKFFKHAGFLTPKQLAIGRNKIKKYAGQLVEIANSPNF